MILQENRKQLTPSMVPISIFGPQRKPSLLLFPDLSLDVSSLVDFTEPTLEEDTVPKSWKPLHRC